MTWFGSLDLAYKYTIVFGSLLVLTILAGCTKVLYDRRRLKKFAEQQANVEAGPKDDQVELNQREKDEGDLFGIRAIEAGFFAGIPQSRPTSRAGSVSGSPSMSTSTLIGGGGLNSPKVQTHSMSSSVTTLPLAHTNDRNRDSSRDSATRSSTSPPRRKNPPTIRLAPSEAELNGRINHSAAVNMNLNVPPSPVLTQGARSPTFGGSDSGESDGRISPRPLSPRSPNFKPEHYAPVPPQIPMPESLRVSVHSAEDTPKSQAASFNDPSPAHSPGHSAPPSPGHPPEAKLPTMPARAFRDEPRSLFPYSERRPSSAVLPEIGTEQPQSEPEQPEPIRLQPHAYQPTHQRYRSDASSVYSQNRMSTHQHKHSNSTDISYNYSFPEHSSRNSLALSAPKEHSRRPSAASSLLAPGSTTSNQTNDPRFSEFYDSYYRHSQLGVASKMEAPKRPKDLNMTQPTIVEVPSPIPSPNPQASLAQPGRAL